MCLILFALQQHPEYPLIVAANRDEFFERPTASADYWHDQPSVLAGRDLQAGGTWLGVNRAGQFAAVTNVRNGQEPQDRPGSRGELVSQNLIHPTTQALQMAQQNRDHYNGFNLISGNAEQLHYFSNRTQQAPRQLSSGIYGLSNAQLDTSWPKVDSAKIELEAITQSVTSTDQLQTQLLEMMANQQQAPADQLPQTGIGDEWEALLSSRFILTDSYGTRATTIVLFHRSGRIDFLEQSFDHQQMLERRRYTL
ncbi:MAG: NRDE family protein [Cellvibrionaceae bacterium]